MHDNSRPATQRRSGALRMLAVMALAAHMAVTAHAQTPAEAGRAWLVSVQRANGQFGSGPLVVRDTAAAVQGIDRHDLGSIAAIRGALFLDGYPATGAEQNARRLVVLAAHGRPQDGARDRLLATLDAAVPGGFGVFVDHPANALDTAFAVLGLAVADDPEHALLASAVGALELAQNGDGGWSLGGASDVFTTAIAVEGLALARDVVLDPAALGPGVAFLIGAQLVDTSFGDALETAVAVVALATADKTFADLNFGSPTSWLVSQQQPDGSWLAGQDPSVFVTAEVLLALALESPDLTILSSDIVFSDPQPFEDDTVTITATVTNVGNADSVSAEVRFVDITLEPGTDIGPATLPDLAIGATADVVIDWQLAGISGARTIAVEIDPDDAQQEVREDNNLATAVLTIVSRPDLTVADFHAEPSEPAPDLPFDLHGTITNIGGSTVASLDYEWFVGDPDQVAPVGGGTISDLGGGQSIELTPIELTLPAATYELFLVIDRAEQVIEQNDDNNSQRLVLAIGDGVGVDFAVTDSGIIIDPLDAPVGTTVAITATVANNGPETATTEVRFYDGAPGASGTTLIANPSVELSGLTSQQIVTSYVLGPDTAVIWVVLDEEGLVIELSDTNNRARRAVSSAVPDLAVYSGDIALSKETPVTNDEVTVTATVHNLATVDAVGAVVEIWDGDPDDGGSLLRSETVSVIAAGDAQSVDATWSATTGLHGLVARVDPDDLLIDPNRADNRAERLVTVIDAVAADLSIASLDVIDIAVDRQTLSVTGDVTLTVVNRGGVDVTDDFIVALFEDRNDNGAFDWHTEHSLGGSVVIGGIDAGTSRSVSFSAIGVADFAESLLYVAVDLSDVANEVDELNNTAPLRRRCGVIRSNLVIDASAELDGVGWNTIEGALATFTDGTNGIDTWDGHRAFSGGAGDRMRSEQVVDLAGFEEVIDAGLLDVSMNGQRRTLAECAVPGQTCDQSRFVVDLRDAGGTPLESFDTGLDAPQGAWQEWNDARMVPVGTRSIRFEMESVRHQGTDNDGYHDGVSCRLDSRTVNLSASHIRLRQPDSLGVARIQFRIGSSGGLTAAAGAAVDVYDGDPDLGGVLITATATTHALAPGAYQDLIVTWPAPTEDTHLVVVVVDPDDLISECIEDDNRVETSFPVGPPADLPDVQVLGSGIRLPDSFAGREDVFVNGGLNTAAVGPLLNDGAGDFDQAGSYCGNTLGPRLGDFDGDGVLDVVLPSWYGTTADVFRGTGDRNSPFDFDSGFTLPDCAGGASVGRFNGDELDDIACGYDGTTVTVWLSDGTNPPSFTLAGSQLAGQDVRLVLAGDFTGDHLLDVVVGAAAGIKVFPGDGFGGLSAPCPTCVSSSAINFQYARENQKVAVDLDGDQNLDFLVPQPFGGTWAFWGDGSGGFTTQQLYPNGAASGVNVTDLDGNGDLEVVLVEGNCGANVRCMVVLDGGGRVWDVHSTWAWDGYGARWLDFGDFNEDGDLDVILGIWQGSNPPLRMFYGHGDLTFDPAVTVPSVTQADGCTFVDVWGLATGIFGPPRGGSAGDCITVTVTVTNPSDETMTDVVVELWEGDPNQGGTLVATEIVPVLPAHSSAVVTFTWCSSTTPGPHTLCAVIDPNNEYEEINENNNQACRTFELPPGNGPDLQVPAVALDPSAVDEGEDVAITATIRNGGDGVDGVVTRIYLGDPDIGGALLHEQAWLPVIGPGETVEIGTSLSTVNLGGVYEIHVLVDPLDSIHERHEDNNRRIATLDVDTTGLDVAVETELPSYPHSTAATITVDVINDGDFEQSPLLVVRILRASGPEIAVVYDHSVTVAAGQSAAVIVVWNTGTHRAGDYIVEATLIVDPLIAGRREASFAIAPDYAAAATLVTDAGAYDPYQTVQIEGAIVNTGVNADLTDLTASLQIFDPSMIDVVSETLAIELLARGAVVPWPYSWPLGTHEPGGYTVRLTVTHPTWGTMATVETAFEVRSSAATGVGLDGSVVATPRMVTTASEVSLDVVVENLGNADITDLEVVTLVVDAHVTPPQTMNSFMSPVASLPIGGSFNATLVQPVAGLAAQEYLVVLQIRLDDGLVERTLDTDFFVIVDVTAPECAITAPLVGQWLHWSLDLSATVTDDLTGVASAAYSFDPMGSNWPVLTPAGGDVWQSSGIDISGLAEGAQTVYVRAADSSGNDHETSGTDQNPCAQTFGIDRTKPQVSIDEPASATVYVSVDFALEATITDPLSGVASAAYRLDTVGPEPLISGGSTWTATVDVDPLTDGSYTLEVVATDIAGNDETAAGPGPNPDTRTVVVDRTPPVITYSLDTGAIPCEGIYHSPLVVMIDIFDSNLDDTTIEVLLDGAPVSDWINGVALPESGDYHIEAHADDLAGNHTEEACGPFRIQLFELDTWVDVEFPRVLLFDDSGQSFDFVRDSLANNGIYYQQETLLHDFVDAYRSGEFDVALLHHATDSGNAVHREIATQVFTEEGLILVKADLAATPELRDAFGVDWYSIDSPHTTANLNASPVSGDEQFYLNGSTIGFTRDDAQIFGRYLYPGSSAPADDCQGLISIEYGIPYPDATTVTVTLSDMIGQVDSETSGGGPADLQTGARADLQILDFGPTGVALRIVTPDLYRLESSFEIHVVLDSASGGSYELTETLTTTCAPPVPPSPFVLAAFEEMSLFGDDPPHMPGWIAAIHRYGLGKALSCGIDLQALATPRMEQLVVDAVDYVKTGRGCDQRLGREVVPVRIRVKNDSPFDAEVELTTELVPDAEVYRTLEPPVSTQPLVHHLSLPAQPAADAEQVVTWLMRLPSAAGAVSGTTTLGSLDDGIDYTDVTEVNLTCEVQRSRLEQADHVLGLLADLFAAASRAEQPTVMLAQQWVQQARDSSASTPIDIEADLVTKLLPAHESLRPLQSVNPSESLIELGHLIRLWEIHWYEAVHP